jgi:ABC-type transport system involved in multi-copper enzyme maturation permease subunit
MNATMAIMARDVMARRELLLMAVAVAIMICFLPFLPNIETYEATDVRTVGSSVSALALGCVLALLLGATVFGNDLSEGRLGFFFARPVRGLAVWWGKVLAVMALVWMVEIIVLAPALYSEGIDIFTSSERVDWLTILVYVIAPLLLFLLAHAVSILVRAGTPWLFLDLGGAIVVAVFSWLNVSPLFESISDGCTARNRWPCGARWRSALPPSPYTAAGCGISDRANSPMSRF